MSTGSSRTELPDPRQLNLLHHSTVRLFEVQNVFSCPKDPGSYSVHSSHCGLTGVPEYSSFGMLSFIGPNNVYIYVCVWHICILCRLCTLCILNYVYADYVYKDRGALGTYSATKLRLAAWGSMPWHTCRSLHTSLCLCHLEDESRDSRTRPSSEKGTRLERSSWV